MLCSAALASLSVPCPSFSAEDSINRRTDERLYSIEVREADMGDVLRALAQQSGLNIILGEGVEGKVSLSFKDVPFKDALDMIIKAHGLMYSVQSNVLWIGKKVDLTDEMVLEIVRLNYAEPSTVLGQLKGALSTGGASYADTRTNSVIIKDLPKNIEIAKRLINSIDVQIAQVSIEARIVEASSSFIRQFGVQWGGSYASGRDSLTGSSLLPASTGDRNFAINLPAANPTAGLGIVIGNLSDNLFLDLELSAAESRGELKIVSRPRISTLNNKAATIHSGLTFRVKTSSSSGDTGTTTTTTTTSTGTTSGIEEIKTGIDLSVTPQISDNGHILLNISTNKSDPDYSHTVDGIPGITEKSASTYVLVKDGDTVVIGGLYKSITSDEDNSVPYLSKIPLIGGIFKSTSKGFEDEELLVFITTRIVRLGSTAEGKN
ncbi:MAG: type IV pilus secretin PilQ [Deltaproteobacteria bacterium]